MIAKRFDMQLPQKSSMKRLVEYLKDEQGKEARVEAVMYSNVMCEGDDFALQEILNTQARNTRSKADKTYHLMVSFREGDSLTPELLKEIEEKFAKGLGYGEHQRVSVLHSDTDNLHFHMAINKVHPEKFTIHEPYYDKKTLGKICKSLEREYGLQIDNHEAKKTESQVRATDMERAGGIESLIGWTQRTCGELLKAADSWSAFHKVLGEHGLEIKPSGRGFTISDGSRFIRASSVDRCFSKQNLEERFGPFIASQKKAEAQKKYKKKPFDKKQSSKALWDTYLEDRERTRQRINVEVNREKEKRDKTIRRIRGVLKAQKAILRLVRYAVIRKALQAIFSKVANMQIEAAKQGYRENKERIKSSYPHDKWLEWLKQKAAQGNTDALAYLQSKRDFEPKGNLFRGEGQEQPVSKSTVKPDSISSKGTIIYPDNLRETKNSILVNSTEPVMILKGLLLAKDKFGGRISVEGGRKFQELAVKVAVEENIDISFANNALEIQKKRLADGKKHIDIIEKYIEKRNFLKYKISDIMNHKLFKSIHAGEKIFAGVRTQDGYSMVLLKHENEIVVVPISNETARSMKSVKIGSVVNVDKKGIITAGTVAPVRRRKR